MKPGNLCSKLLHKLGIGPSEGESAHIFEVARRKALHLRKGSFEVLRQTIHDFGAPAVLLLAFENGLAHRMIKQHELAVNREMRTKLRAGDLSFESRQQLIVASLV